MGSQGTLGGSGSSQSVGGARERNEERVALGIDLAAAVRLKRGAHYPTLRVQHLGVARAKLLDEARGAFDVGEEEGNGASR
jgi:hypothetical protein